MKERHTRRQVAVFLLSHAACVAGGLLFLLLDRRDLFDRILICPLHVLGLYCPTCGMTRAAHSLLALDLAGALTYHPLLPLLAACLLYYDGFWLASLGKRQTARRPARLPLYLTIAAFLLFFLVRNLLLLGFGIDPIGDFT